MKSRKLSSKALFDFFSQIKQLRLEVNSLVVLQDGDTAVRWRREPYRMDTPQLLYSLSKSFTSIAVGIAWDNGYLDLNDPIVSFFPHKLPDSVSPNLSRMTIHHLLSMNAGHSIIFMPLWPRSRTGLKLFSHKMWSVSREAAIATARTPPICCRPLSSKRRGRA